MSKLTRVKTLLKAVKLLHSGFYPQHKALAAHMSTSAIGNNETTNYGASISVNVSANQLKRIIEKAKSFPNAYNLNIYNCTDYVIELGNLAGMNLPDCWGAYPSPLPLVNGGSNPGALGEHIRSLPPSSNYTTVTETGNAPSNRNFCN